MSVPPIIAHLPEWTARLADHRAVCKRRPAACILADAQSTGIGQGWSGGYFAECAETCSCIDAEVRAVMFLQKRETVCYAVLTHFPNAKNAAMLAEIGVDHIYYMNEDGYTDEAREIFEKAHISNEKIDFSLGG